VNPALLGDGNNLELRQRLLSESKTSHTFRRQNYKDKEKECGDAAPRGEPQLKKAELS
jgi:hypothetical protein